MLSNRRSKLFTSLLFFIISCLSLSTIIMRERQMSRHPPPRSPGRLKYLWLFVSLPSLWIDSGCALQTSKSSSSSSNNNNNKAHRISKEILQGLQQSSTTPKSSHLLDLETDFYDATTGLYSEGVWHNCMAGIASLKNNQQDQALQIANSLFQCSWDGISFRRRAWSGNWDHSRLGLKDDDDDAVVQANYYQESSEHRCIQHGLALVFWSLLALESSDDNTMIRQQQTLIAQQFIDEFWNGQRWTTTSRIQGGGTTLRPSASSGQTNNKGIEVLEEEEQQQPYFRAADQAVAVLACLQHLQVLQDPSEEHDHIQHIIKTTCKNLLDGFGYDNLSMSQTYLGLNRNRNFWHEGWVLLSLCQARDYVWPMDTQDGHLRALWEGLLDRYQGRRSNNDDDDDGAAIIWHWALEQKDFESNVCYCGDNVLAHAICRNLQLDNDNENDAFWSFVDMLRSKNTYQLASVANVYPQVRLHPNTELAALLVWP